MEHKLWEWFDTSAKDVFLARPADGPSECYVLVDLSRNRRIFDFENLSLTLQELLLFANAILIVLEMGRQDALEGHSGRYERL
ncbi:MAG TPA: hypothetical protein VIS99_12835 [Terrimicrobiaceae bacterium]